MLMSSRVGMMLSSRKLSGGASSSNLLAVKQGKLVLDYGRCGRLYISEHDVGSR